MTTATTINTTPTVPTGTIDSGSCSGTDNGNRSAGGGNANDNCSNYCSHLLWYLPSLPIEYLWRWR